MNTELAASEAGEKEAPPTHRYYTNHLPVGAYKFKLLGVEDKGESVAGHPYYQLKFELEGTDRLEYDYLYGTEAAEWKSRAYGASGFHIQEIRELVGRTYLIEYKVRQYDGQQRGQLGQILAKYR